MWRLLCLAAVIHIAAGQCQFEDGLLGNWTSSSFGTLQFSNSTPQFVMNVGFVTGTTETSFDCYLNNGEIYVLESTETYNPLDDSYEVNIYMCLDFRKAGEYSYYFYQNSPTNSGLQGRRAKAISSSRTDVTESEVCSSILDPADFKTMVKQGFEREAAIQCADPLLMSATYTYTDSSGTYCAGLNTTLVDTCNQHLTTIQFNDSDVTDTACQSKNPGFSEFGKLGCVANVFNSNSSQYYVFLYNYDDVIDGVTKFQFTCASGHSTDGTKANPKMSTGLEPITCKAGQTSTVLPINGALMVFTPFETCLPTSGNSDSTTATNTGATTAAKTVILASLLGSLEYILHAVLAGHCGCFN